MFIGVTASVNYYKAVLTENKPEFATVLGNKKKYLQ